MNKMNRYLLIFIFLTTISTKSYSFLKCFEDRLILSYSGGISHLKLNFSSSNATYNTLNFSDKSIGGMLCFPIPSIQYKVYKNFYVGADLKLGAIRFDRKSYAKNILNEYYPAFIIEDLSSKDSEFFIINYQFGISYKFDYNRFSLVPKLLYGKIQFSTPEGNAILKQEFNNNKVLYTWKSEWFDIPHLISFSTQFNYQLNQKVSISLILTKSFGKLEDSEYTIKTEDIYGNVNIQTYLVSGNSSSYTTAEFGINYSF